MPWSRTAIATRCRPTPARSTSTGSPASEYLTALSSRLVTALTTWRRSHATTSVGQLAVDLERDAARPRPAAAPARPPRAISTPTGTGSAVGDSWASIRLRSSRSSTMRPSRSASRSHALGELAHDGLVVLGGHGLGQQRERADRRLQLVADVGHEVAAHALDAPDLGDVADEADRADDLALVEQRHRPAATGPRGGGPNSWSSRSPLWPCRARSSSSSIGSSATASACAASRYRAAASLRSSSVPAASTTMTRVAAGPASASANGRAAREPRRSGARVAPGEPARRARRGLTGRRPPLGTASAQPNRPVM